MLHDAAPDKGRWSGPQSHVGTRGSWRSSGGEQSGSTEGGQGRSVLPKLLVAATVKLQNPVQPP